VEERKTMIKKEKNQVLAKGEENVASIEKAAV
jgi:hypothetical protein